MNILLAAHVDASPEDIWKLIVDIEGWPQFTASVSDVKRVDAGPLGIGSEAIVKQPRLPVARWRVTDLIDGRSFTWETRSPGLTTIGSHVVEPDDDGATVTLTLDQRGPLAPVAGALFGSLVRRYVAMELAGFKTSAEIRR